MIITAHGIHFHVVPSRRRHRRRRASSLLEHNAPCIASLRALRVLQLSDTLDAYIDKYGSLVSFLADNASAGVVPPSDPAPPDLSGKAISLQVSVFGSCESVWRLSWTLAHVFYVYVYVSRFMFVRMFECCFASRWFSRRRLWYSTPRRLGSGSARF